MFLFLQLMQQLKQRNPVRFDADETEETEVCDEEEEGPVCTGTPVCPKRRKTAAVTATSTVMDRIEQRIAAHTQAQQQLLEKVKYIFFYFFLFYDKTLCQFYK